MILFWNIQSFIRTFLIQYKKMFYLNYSIFTKVFNFIINSMQSYPSLSFIQNI